MRDRGPRDPWARAGWPGRSVSGREREWRPAWRRAARRGVDAEQLQWQRAVVAEAVCARCSRWADDGAARGDGDLAAVRIECQSMAREDVLELEHGMVVERDVTPD